MSTEKVEENGEEKAENLLSLMRVRVNQGNLEETKKIMKLLPLEKIDSDMCDTFIVQLMNDGSDWKDIIKFLYDVWSELEAYSNWNIYTYSLRFNLTEQVLRLIPELSERSFFEFALDLIEQDGTPQNLEALNRLFI